MENFLTILSGFLVPLIAIITVYIAYKQYKLDSDKLKWNLYSNRMEIYQSLRDLFGYVMRKANVSIEELNKFIVAKNKGFFLFNSDINNYLSKVVSKCLSLKQLKRKLGNKELKKGPERDKLAKEEAEIFLWFDEQHEEAKRLFEEYLKIK